MKLIPNSLRTILYKTIPFLPKKFFLNSHVFHREIIIQENKLYSGRNLNLPAYGGILNKNYRSRKGIKTVCLFYTYNDYSIRESDRNGRIIVVSFIDLCEPGSWDRLRVGRGGAVCPTHVPPPSLHPFPSLLNNFVPLTTSHSGESTR